MPQYPRVITLNHPKLIKLEQEKGTIIEEGRAISQKIEEVELEMGKLDTRLQIEESKVDIKDLKLEGDGLVKEMEALIQEYTGKIKAIEVKIFDRMKANTDNKLREDHEVLAKQKEELENERNKKALKAQKIKDRIIPLARRVLAPHLENKYEDFYDIRLKDGVIVGTIFSHLNDWDKNFTEKLKKQTQ